MVGEGRGQRGDLLTGQTMVLSRIHNYMGAFSSHLPWITTARHLRAESVEAKPQQAGLRRAVMVATG